MLTIYDGFPVVVVYVQSGKDLNDGSKNGGEGSNEQEVEGSKDDERRESDATNESNLLWLNKGLDGSEDDDIFAWTDQVEDGDEINAKGGNENTSKEVEVEDWCQTLG